MSSQNLKSKLTRDITGYFPVGFREKKPQELTLSAGTHNEFTALTYEVIELMATVPIYYLITSAGTAATASGSACFYLPANNRKEIICNVGDVVSVISASSGQANLIEKG